MKSLGMDGPFVFNASEIDKQITRTIEGTKTEARRFGTIFSLHAL